MGLYDVHSRKDVLSVKTCIFIGDIYKRYITNTLDKETALMLLTSIWNVVSGLIDKETVEIYDAVYEALTK